MAKKNGRPVKEIDFKFLDGLLKCGATKVQCSNILEVSEDTIERRIREKHGVTFSKYRDAKLDGIRMLLVQKAMQIAQSGNVTMLIFCLKNICGWGDKIDINASQKGIVKLAYNLDDKQKVIEAKKNDN